MFRIFRQRLDVANVMLICDHLEPAGWFPRPQVRLEVLDWYVAGQFNINNNTVQLNPEACENLHKVAAHEVRHWWQHHAGWLAWDGEWVWWQGERRLLGSEVDYLVRHGTEEEYFRLPWERDAEDFANEYMRHLAKTLAA